MIRGPRSVWEECDDLRDCIKFAGASADSLDQLPVFAGIGASMLQGIRVSHTALGVAAACTIVISGCATLMVPSQRLHEPELNTGMSGPIPIGGHRFGRQDSSACTACEDRQRLQDYTHCAIPYVAGPFMHPGRDAEYVAEQATIETPHSKFHPVPTRPVFETRASYHPPQPIGVHLVPVPDQHSHPMPMTPHLHEPDSHLDLPPTPPIATPESMDAIEVDDDGLFIIQPPSE